MASPYFVFGTDQSTISLSQREVIVEQAISKIDYFEVKTTLVVPGSPALQFGAPTQFRYGDTVSQQLFEGYIQGANDSMNSVARRNLMVLQGLGTAEVMRNRSSRSWSNRTMPEVVREIAARYRFNVVSDGSSLRWKTLSQEDQTDWNFICSMAERIGWWAYCMGTTIYFLNPAFLAGRQSPLVINADVGRFNQTSQDQPYMGENRLRILRGRWTDPTTGKTHWFEPEPYVPFAGKAPPRRTTEEVTIKGAATYAEARIIFLGWEKSNAWYMDRRLTIPGRIDVHPYRSVHIRTPRSSGTRAALGFDAYDGYWIIKGVQHRLTFGATSDFTTELSLVRDGRGQPVRRHPMESPIAWDRRPPSRLIGSRWVSAWTAA